MLVNMSKEFPVHGHHPHLEPNAPNTAPLAGN
jgi:hypothetical protein